MPSPFPGMDPYLEGQVWGEFHHKLIDAMQDALVPLVRPRYEVAIEERVYVEHHTEERAGHIIPDVAIAERPPQRGATPGGGGVAVLAEPVVVPLLMPEEMREPFLEIRRAGTGQVVTVIEVLSPPNKRPGADGHEEYLRKRGIVLRGRPHLLELDLLRGGERLPMARPLPPGDFYAILSRSTPLKGSAHVWPFTLRDRLPVVPVPLAGADPDVLLDLQPLFTTVYDLAGYDYRLDYQHGTQPPLSAEGLAWADGLLAAAARQAESDRQAGPEGTAS